jgi:hypothetical protein
LTSISPGAVTAERCVLHMKWPCCGSYATGNIYIYIWTFSRNYKKYICWHTTHYITRSYIIYSNSLLSITILPPTVSRSLKYITLLTVVILKFCSLKVIFKKYIPLYVIYNIYIYIYIYIKQPLEVIFCFMNCYLIINKPNSI